MYTLEVPACETSSIPSSHYFWTRRFAIQRYTVLTSCRSWCRHRYTSFFIISLCLTWANCVNYIYRGLKAQINLTTCCNWCSLFHICFRILSIDFHGHTSIIRLNTAFISYPRLYSSFSLHKNSEPFISPQCLHS